MDNTVSVPSSDESKGSVPIDNGSNGHVAVLSDIGIDNTHMPREITLEDKEVIELEEKGVIEILYEDNEDNDTHIPEVGTDSTLIDNNEVNEDNDTSIQPLHLDDVILSEEELIENEYGIDTTSHSEELEQNIVETSDSPNTLEQTDDTNNIEDAFDILLEEESRDLHAQEDSEDESSDDLDDFDVLMENENEQETTEESDEDETDDFQILLETEYNNTEEHVATSALASEPVTSKENLRATTENTHADDHEQDEVQQYESMVSSPEPNKNSTEDPDENISTTPMHLSAEEHSFSDETIRESQDHNQEARSTSHTREEVSSQHIAHESETTQENADDDSTDDNLDFIERYLINKNKNSSSTQYNQDSLSTHTEVHATTEQQEQSPSDSDVSLKLNVTQDEDTLETSVQDSVSDTDPGNLTRETTMTPHLSEDSEVKVNIVDKVNLHDDDMTIHPPESDDLNPPVRMYHQKHAYNAHKTQRNTKTPSPAPVVTKEKVQTPAPVVTKKKVQAISQTLKPITPYPHVTAKTTRAYEKSITQKSRKQSLTTKNVDVMEVETLLMVMQMNLKRLIKKTKQVKSIVDSMLH